ncbi:MAG: hypothetical protein U5L07_15780 [Desulfobacterales bacterium]|nr:hypothetical protein [Desulfobacterales bacterium]
MKLPNADQAIIPTEKLQNYLLSPNHPVGKFKAAFFRAIGYTNDNWQQLESEIRALLTLDAYASKSTDYGQKYEIRGYISSPLGGKVNIVTVWIIRVEEQIPHFITAYPGDQR